MPPVSVSATLSGNGASCAFAASGGDASDTRTRPLSRRALTSLQCVRSEARRSGVCTFAATSVHIAVTAPLPLSTTKAMVPPAAGLNALRPLPRSAASGGTNAERPRTVLNGWPAARAASAPDKPGGVAAMTDCSSTCCAWPLRSLHPTVIAAVRKPSAVEMLRSTWKRVLVRNPLAESMVLDADAMSAYEGPDAPAVTVVKSRSDSMSSWARRSASPRWRAMSALSLSWLCSLAVPTKPKASTRKASSASTSETPRCRRRSGIDPIRNPSSCRARGQNCRCSFSVTTGRRRRRRSPARRRPGSRLR